MDKRRLPDCLNQIRNVKFVFVLPLPLPLPPPPPLPAISWSQRFCLFLATGLGVGWSRVAPGTIGSLWGIPVAWAFQAANLPGWGYACASILLFLSGVVLCGVAAQVLGTKDPGAVVFDEIAAFPLVFAWTPLTATTAVTGFVLFRLFDILKPWPIRRFEKLPGGWGIMADDTIAGLLAAAVLWGTRNLLEQK